MNRKSEMSNSSNLVHA